MEIILNTGSTAFQGAVIKGGRKFTSDYTREAAYCNINPEDFDALEKPWFVKVTNEFGDSVVCKAKKDDRQQKGEIFIPRGLWANIVVTPLTECTGSPKYKNLRVKVEKTTGPVLGPVDLMRDVYCKGKNEKEWQGEN